jgi:hypothetical protein
VTLLDDEASFEMVCDKVSVGNIEGIHMPGLRIKAFSPESRTKSIAPSAGKRVDLPAALAMKANNIMERYSLEEREQIADILLILSAKPQQFPLQFLKVVDARPTVKNETSIWATDERTAVRMASDASLDAEATGIRGVDHQGCTVFEQNSDFCIL